MGSASNLLMIFMTVEMASLPSYVLAGFRKTHRLGAEASLKYVLFGASCSAVMAYGLSLLYGLYGTLQLYSAETASGHFAGLAERIAVAGGLSPLLVVGLLGVVCGLGFKIAAVPFHFWCPDVFEGAGIDVTTFLSVASKGAGLVLLLRFAVALGDAAGFAPTAASNTLAAILGVLGAITCTVGNTGAFTQTNLKRLLGYSSIAHAGYMLCAVSLVVRHDATYAAPGNQAAQAVLLYLAVYVFMNLGAFTVAALVARESGDESLDAFKGLGRRAPLLAASLFACLVSLIGLPPFAGFVAKLNLMWALAQNGGAWWGLVAVIGVNTVLSAFYYFRIVRTMYLEAPRASTHRAFHAHPLGTGLSVACAIALVALFIGFNPLSNATTAGHPRVSGVALTRQAPR